MMHALRNLANLIHQFAGAGKVLSGDLQMQAPKTLAARLRVAKDAPLWSKAAKGIFWSSVVRLDSIRRSGSPALSLTYVDPHHKRSKVTCPAGALVHTTTIEKFTFDIGEIGAIGASRSSQRHFDSIDAFGKDYCEFKRLAPSEEALSAMLVWPEVRIGNPGTEDRIDIRLWDGRFMLSNGGGSHHFAGAVHIAGQLKKSVTFTSRLDVHRINPCAWAWLFDRKHVVLCHRLDAHGLAGAVAARLGEGAVMDFGQPFTEGGSMLIFAKDGPVVKAVLDEFKAEGFELLDKRLQTLRIGQDREIEKLVARGETRFVLL